jgi:hypothetical protein
MKRFSYCSNAMVPKIPSAQDVLFALRLSKQEDVYSFCRGNHEVYVDNVQLVVDKIGAMVKSVWPNEVKAKQVIAKAIVDLCPEEARCLFNTAYVEAKIMAGQEHWEVVLSSCAEILRQTCTCPEHRQPATEERQQTLSDNQ